MRLKATALLGIFISTTVLMSAEAVSRRDIGGMRCANVQSILRSQGTVMLRYRSQRNPSNVVYDYYTSGNNRCRTGGYGRRATVPTADTRSCRVHRCVKPLNGGGR